ncbi:MAG TPA: 50S ribosomal protein L3 [Gemmatimonadota bacterium]|nr:50S ribosomal protein L3 [Gemmatimonadota bacterium]
MAGLIGKKIGMTQVFDDEGRAFAVTVIKAGPNYVTQVKTEERDGYRAVQLGFEEAREKHVTKPVLGHLAAAGVRPVRRLEEFLVRDSDGELEPGAELSPADVLAPGDRVDVVGVSKGKGFQGVVKRHGHHGFDASHGTKTHHRRPGSMGQAADPAKTFKNRKLPGQTGNRRTTIRNLEVLKVDADQQLVFLKGSVPGARNAILRISKAGA